MSEQIFPATLEKAAGGNLSIGELINAATALIETSQTEPARQLYKAWIDSNPKHPLLFVAHFNRSALDTQSGDTAAAIESLRQAIALNADFMPAYINLGGMIERSGAPAEAIELWKTVVSRPLPISGNMVNCATAALKQMARVLTDHLQTAMAESAAQLCLDINPHQQDVIEQYIAMRLAQCKWPVLVPRENLDRKALLRSMHPLSMSAYTDDPLLQLASADRYIRLSPHDGPQSLAADRRQAPIDLAGRRLKVGYISSDLRDHAIGYLMAEFFELHGKGGVEVFAYYCGPESNGALTERIKAAVEHWTDIRNLSDDEAANKIAGDGIDILVDINGHTRDARTGVFARRPAPVQVNWLGYPGTMGTPYHHYIIADEWIIPPGSEIYYSEKVLRLPCYQANDRKRVVAAERPTRRDAGLPDDAFVFCCFNGTHKISRFTFERWMQILKRVPDSVLWLLDTSVETKKRLGEFSEGRGVAAERIIFAPKQPNPQHLARYVLADLFLDSVPYGAHTTASDALWAGVPVLTLSGRSFASRVCGSLVRSAGLDDLVTTRAEDYVERAVVLGNDRAAVELYKQKLEGGRSSCRLFDTQMLVDRIEDLYRTMARDHAKGQTPRPDLTNLEAYLEIGIDQDHEEHETLTVADYHGHYKSKLARRHLARTLQPDRRLWTAQQISQIEADTSKKSQTASNALVQPKAPTIQSCPNVTEHVLRELKKQGYAPKTMLDVGAHIGTFTRSFLEIFPDCLPTLIEPNPFCQNDLSVLGFEQHNVAAAEKQGSATLFLTKEWLQSTGCSLYRENTAFFRDEVVVKREVETQRIDDLFAGRQFDFVKIDTQGSELDVLRGGETVLRQANYILVEVSLVDYNAGGAKAEAIFEQLRAMGFQCADVAEFHRLAGVHNGDLLQMDFLFERRAMKRPFAGANGLANIRAFGQLLLTEGRKKDALTVLEFLAAIEPHDVSTLRSLAQLLASEGRTLDALNRLCELKAVSADMDALLVAIQDQMPAALKGFNDHHAAGEIGEAEKYLSALITLIPRNKALLDAALTCNLALANMARAGEYAATLLSIDPAHSLAQSTIAHAAPKADNAPQTATSPVAESATPAHPLVRLRDIHDEVSAILCETLTEQGSEHIESLLNEARLIPAQAPQGSEWESWEKHYRVMLSAIDLARVQAVTPEHGREPPLKLVSSTGEPTSWLQLRATAARLGAQAVFFAAADQAYVDLYVPSYINSILKHCDVPCLVIIHVIGGAGRLTPVSKGLGIKNKRLFFTGDRFDAASVTTKCFDAPPKGLIEKPVAHYQSVRFLRLGSLLQKLKLPIFVSDIDLMLQRGVEDLIKRSANADIVLNQNDENKQAGSRITANLLLVNPTDNASLFLGFLRSYLEKRLGEPEVTRWIDQVALLMARHHLLIHGNEPRVDYFDTRQDINNVMYPSYQNNPFRFLSLYHGFDMSSLPTAKGADMPKRKRNARRVRRTGT